LFNEKLSASVDFAPDSLTRPGSALGPRWQHSPQTQCIPVADLEGAKPDPPPPPLGDGFTASLTVLLICDNGSV